MDSEIQLLVKAGKRRLQYLVFSSLVLILFELNIYFIFERYSDRVSSSERHETQSKLLDISLRKMYVEVGNASKEIDKIKATSKYLEVDKNYSKNINRYNEIFELIADDKAILYVEYDYAQGIVVFKKSRRDYVNKWTKIQSQMNFKLSDKLEEVDGYPFGKVSEYYIKLAKDEENSKYSAAEVERSFLIAQSAIIEINRLDKLIKVYGYLPTDTIEQFSKLDREEITNLENKIRENLENIQIDEEKVKRNKVYILSEGEIGTLKNQIRAELNNSVNISGFPISITTFMPITPLLIVGLYHWFYIYLKRLKNVLILTLRTESVIHIDWMILFRERTSLLSTLLILLVPFFYCIGMLMVAFFIIIPLLNDVGIDYDFPLATGKSIILSVIGSILCFFYWVASLSEILQILDFTKINRTRIVQAV